MRVSKISYTIVANATYKKNRILVMMATKSIIITKMLKLIFLDPKQPPVIRSQEWPIFEWKCEMPEGPTE